MLKKLVSHLVAAIVAVSLVSVAHAADKQKFDATAFAAAQAAGKPILVEIHADWCPTCKAQAPILSDLTGKERFKALQVFTVDFDSQKDVVRALGARAQSTLITFKGKTETGRSVGDTNAASIAALLNTTS